MARNEERIDVGLVKRACPVCGKVEAAEIVIGKWLRSGPDKGPAEKLHGEVVGYMDGPCDRCWEEMALGIILITVDPDKSDMTVTPPNFYRTGGHFVVREEAVKRFINEPMLSDVLKHRMSFIDHAIAEQLGFFEMAKDAPKH